MGLVHGILDALFVAAPKIGVQDLLKHRGLPLDGGHDAAQVPGLYRVSRHLERHARDLDVPLGQLAAAAYDAHAHELLDEARLDLYGIGQLLLGVGAVLQDAREVAACRVIRANRHPALDALLYHLQGQVFLVLEGQDVPEHLHVLGREQSVPPTRAGEVDQPPSLEVPHLAHRERRELFAKPGHDLAYSVMLLLSTVLHVYAATPILACTCLARLLAPATYVCTNLNRYLPICISSPLLRSTESTRTRLT